MQEQWSSKLGFILASIGSAVGIGNIWRFPYVMGANGGGTFLLVYLICICLFGIPLMLLELATGRKFGKSIVKTFEHIGPKVKKFSLIPLITIFFIMSYYLVVTGWVLKYFINFAIGTSPQFNFFVNGYTPIVFTTISLIITGMVVLMGIKSIEKISKILVPFAFILLLMLALRVFFSPNSMEGIIHYFKPDLTNVFNLKMWLVASGQALFSLSAGYGILITYGSYLKKEEDIPRSTLIISFSDVLFSILAAVVIFSAVYSFGLSPTEGPKLAFVVMPQIFQQMNFGYLIGSVFFLLLFISAITSSISMTEFLTKNVMDEFNFGRKKSGIIIFGLLFLLSGVVSLSYSGILQINLLELFDNIFGNFLTPISAVIICLAIAWYWKIDDLIDEMHIEDSLTLEKLGSIGKYIEHLIAYTIVLNLIKFVVPAVLLVLFIVRVLGI